MSERIPHSTKVGKLDVIVTPDIRHVGVTNKCGLTPVSVKGWSYSEDHELPAIYEEACQFAKDNQPTGGGLFG